MTEQMHTYPSGVSRDTLLRMMGHPVAIRYTAPGGRKYTRPGRIDGISMKYIAVETASGNVYKIHMASILTVEPEVPE